jgi:hypothetical protein
MKSEYYVIDKNELKEAFKEFAREQQNEVIINPVEQSARMNRYEAAKFLGVSYPTMFLWTKKKIIQEHGQGRKKFYLRPELIEVLRQKS